MPKYFILLVFFIFPGLLAFAQVKDSTIPLFFEKAYLHTDREHYLAGENLWFKAYLVNARDNKLINTSNTLYVELIAPGAVVRDKKIIRMYGGLGNGDFKLSDSLNAGTYRLRAYTNWMRNFGDNFVFEKELKIYGGKKAKPQPAKPVLAMLPDKKKASLVPPIANNVPINIISDTVRFFPEGGSMVENISGTVAYKAEDEFGRGLGLKGIIETQSGEKITDINSTAGMGSFALKPLPGIDYFATGQYANGKQFKIKLPSALLKGLAMQVSNQDSIIIVDIACNKEIPGRTLSLTCKSKGKLYKSINITITGPIATLRISPGELPAGVNCLTLYDDTNKPNCERLIYIGGEEKQSFQLSTDKTAYTSKEKTTLTINAPANTKLSVAVTDAGLVSPNQLNINSYLNLQSELRGRIENPHQYFDKDNPKRKQQLDLLLMTQGWRDFVWRRLADSALRISYIPEKGITISGSVKEMFSPKPMPGMNITLFIDSAADNKLFTARTDSSGRFYIDNVKFYGNQPFNVNAINDKGRRRGWITADTANRSKYPISKIAYPPDTLPAVVAFKTELENRLQIVKKFKTGDTVHLKDVKIVANPLTILKTYVDTAIMVNRNDYRYKTLGAYVGRLYAKYTAMLYAKYTNGVFSKYEPPKLVITSDSLPAMRTPFTNLYNIPMDQIISIRCRAIKIYGNGTYKQMMQGFGFSPDGATYQPHIWIDIVVKPHAFDTPDFHVANLDIDGYYKARTFYAPRYEITDTKPDLRTTIYWEPNITTDKNDEAKITYYNADPKTKVLVSAEGITDSGVTVAAHLNYVVK